MSDNYDLVTADIDDGCDGSDVYIATISASTSAELATKVDDTYAVNTNVYFYFFTGLTFRPLLNFSLFMLDVILMENTIVVCFRY